MIPVNHYITVIPTESLAEIHLFGMVGHKGKVAEPIFSTEGDLIGYMVCLDKPFQDECLWFVPKDAVCHEKDS